LLAGICGTDLELARGYMDFRGVPGHEFVGIVEQAPEDRLLGRRVVGEINCPEGLCDLCKRGLGKHCPTRSVLGIQGRDGALAEYLALPCGNLHVVPEGLPNERAVFTELLAACFEPMERGYNFRGKSVAVLGDGKLGLLMAQVLNAQGADVLAVGKYTRKLRILQALGIRTALREDVDGPVADTVIECTGSPDGLAHALRIVRTRGTVILKTTIAAPVEIELARAVVDEITLVGSRCGPFAPALSALARGEVRVDELIEDIFDFEDVLEAFDCAARPGALKVLVRVSADG